MKPKKRLKDTCCECGNRVWQYAKNGDGYCEEHARWKHIEVVRMAHPHDAHHKTIVSSTRVDRAIKSVIDTIQRLGYSEAFWVAEHLTFEWGVQWWDEQVVIRLSDLQIVAFASAMKAHHEALYPTKAGKRGKKKTKRD